MPDGADIAPNWADFSDLVKRSRLAARLTQERLAERAGLNVRSVRDIEGGKVRFPRPETARVLGGALGFSGDELDGFVAKARAEYWNGRGEPPDDSSAPPPGSSAQPIRCLPRRINDLSGRVVETEDVLRLVLDDQRSSPTVIPIDGMAGIGKTTLAVDLAYQIGSRYPDAHLYIDLHGHSEQSPIESGEALGTLLRQIGVPPERVPTELADRVAMWRTELSGRRTVLVLDNARDSDQVVPLLPAAPGSVTLITSRQRLIGLDGADPMSLGSLGMDASIDLLTRVVGDRIRIEFDAATQVVALCGQLPLALRLAASRLAHRPNWTVTDLLIRLRNAQPPPVDLAAEGRTVSAAFSLSYEQLPDSARRTFRLLGVHPAGLFDAHAAAAVADLPLDRTDEILEYLVDIHLIEAPAANRYGFHDLLRDYANRLFGHETTTEREAVRQRLFDYYLHTTAGAVDRSDLHRRLATPLFDFGPRKTESQEFTEKGAALVWLDQNWSNVAATAGLAHQQSEHRHACLLARSIWPYFFHGHPHDASVRLDERALAAAEALGDDNLLAIAHNYLAGTYLRIGRSTESAEHIRSAADIRRSLGDDIGTAAAVSNLATVLLRIGRFHEALEWAKEALTLGLAFDPTYGSRAQSQLGWALRMVGRPGEALVQHRRQLAEGVRSGNDYRYALALGELVRDHLSLGHHRLAALLARRAVSLKVEHGNPYGAAEALSDLGIAFRGLRQLTDALNCHREAVAQIRDLVDPGGEADILNELGITLVALGVHDEAAQLFREALHLARRVGGAYETARAHAGLADALRHSEPTTAAEHYRVALALFEEMGTPERHTVAQRIADLG